jgi:hypothetical protein
VAVEVRHLTYCTVRAMVVFWVTVPEVAVMVTICTPAGVTGALGVAGGELTGVAAAFMELEQPAMSPVDASSTRAMPRSCNGLALLIDRLRAKRRKEPKGMRKATAIAAELLCHGL